MLIQAVNPCPSGWCGPWTVGNWSWGRDYLRWRSWVLNRTSSNMWPNWNLPMLILRNRSLTLMYMASVMVLVMLSVSLSTMEKLSTLVTLAVVLTWSSWGRGPCDVTWAFPQCSLQIPHVILITLPICNTYTCVLLHSSVMLSCPLGPPGGFWCCCLPWNGLGPPFCN